MSTEIKFRFVEFNPLRSMRGEDAARVEVMPIGYLWMSKSDIEKNIKFYGPHPELKKALDAYKAGAAVTASNGEGV